MKNINWVIKHLTLGAPNYTQSFFEPLVDWEVYQLMILKWGLTIVFTFYFFLLTYFLLKKVFNNSKAVNRAVFLTYTIITLVSALLFIVGSLFNISSDLYSTIRNLMGILQSFIPAMLVYLIFKFK